MMCCLTVLPERWNQLCLASCSGVDTLKYIIDVNSTCSCCFSGDTNLLCTASLDILSRALPKISTIILCIQDGVREHMPWGRFEQVLLGFESLERVMFDRWRIYGSEYLSRDDGKKFFPALVAEVFYRFNAVYE